KPRKKEKYGKDYYFFTNNKFREEIKKGNILEYQNTRNKNIYYGTFKIDLENKLLKGYNIIVNPDIT
ncbi:MAG: guanylate kinase, partial [Parcubacteria group bacterium CG_4_9_14_0_2_um_filter_41_8]